MFIFDAFKCVRNHNLERRPLPGQKSCKRAPPGTRLHERFTCTIHIHTSTVCWHGRTAPRKKGGGQLEQLRELIQVVEQLRELIQVAEGHERKRRP